MRIKIKIPEPTVFNCQLTVRVSDLNYSGHLGNDAVLALTHEARVQYLESLGVTELAIGAKDEGLVMVDSAIEYKSEAFQGEQLSIGISIDNIREIAFDIYFLLQGADGRTVAKVKSGHVAFNYTTRKLSKFAPFFLEKLAAKAV